ncbi:uncharacterized protein [Amphiura filiformis]|uniref:uncharacterized protein n=1 Tax=Amphiura filiformis TaxID=82378 RepID=UPI003B2153BE
MLPSGLFKGLSNLEYLYLSGNQLISLENHLFNETRKLTLLWLFYNDLSVLPSELFKGLSNLEVLYLFGNQIISLESDLFNETTKLSSLSLSDNNLTVLPSGLFKGLTNLEKLSLSQNQIISSDEVRFNETTKLILLLPSGLFKGLSNLKELSLNENKLQHLPKQLFHGLHKLAFLFLYKNELTSLDRTMFQGLSSLQVLGLQENMIEHISYDLFKGLQHLIFLSLGINRLTNLNHQIFSGLRSLQILYLRYNKFRALDIRLFKDMINLFFLDLSGNYLTNIPNMSNLSKLALIDLRENKLTKVDRSTFIDLPKQVEILVNQTEICECYVPNDVNCSAVDDRSPYLTCDRLLSDRVLVVMMWLIGLNALGGNLFVLSRSRTKNKNNTVQTFLLSNLAMSDLLMGIYMLIIASTDIYFGEYFPMQAETWRSGITCRIIGAMSIISSEASVFFITLISVDRFINIRFPYSLRKLRKGSSAVIVALLWLTSFVLGIVPSVLAGGNGKFYDNSHVCIGLPLAQIERFSKNVSRETVNRDGFIYYKYLIQSESLGHVPGLYYASALFLGLNGICYFVILLCYVEIVRCVSESSKRVGLNKDMKEQIRMTVKVAAIVLTDFFCWAPVILMGILVQLNVLTLPSSVFAWSVTVILPINSAINPYLYTIAAVISNHRKKKNSFQLTISKHHHFSLGIVGKKITSRTRN